MSRYCNKTETTDLEFMHVSIVHLYIYSYNFNGYIIIYTWVGKPIDLGCVGPVMEPICTCLLGSHTLHECLYGPSLSIVSDSNRSLNLIDFWDPVSS